MLSGLGFAMVAIFMTLITTRRLSALAALILVPTAVALVAGFGPQLGPMMLAGIKDLAPTAVMLLFAILYFGVMIDAGLFEPLVKAIVRATAGDPVRTMFGVVALALVVGLDGDGSTTYMITIVAMLPLFKQQKLDVRILACLAIMASGVSNLLPWGGPTARAATALHLDPAALFLSLLPALLLTAIYVFFVAWWLGRRERARLALNPPEPQSIAPDAPEEPMLPEGGSYAKRPKLIWFNLALTLALMAGLVLSIMPLPVMFMLGFAVALVVNYPKLEDQRERLYAHAGNALSVGGLVFAAGLFTGILSGTGMVEAMAKTVIEIIPPQAGPYMAPITALISLPFTFLISNDAFYFGMLPILAQAGAAYGITPEQMARASLIGQQVHLLSPLVPSTYLLVSMVGIELAEHQRFTIRWALGAALVMMLGALAIGAFPLIAG
ncbi:MAG: citrate transporter [Caulobacterales bacterium 68-7]|nr:citrate transporter [Caulobacterales bacterium]OJU11265.1 MAG: citrate transporter [Caulobacterales bacterium 68-7]